MQVEKKEQKEAEKEQQNVHDVEMLHNQQVEEKHAMEKAIVNYVNEYDLDNPGDAQMMPPGLVGEDPDSKSRLQRQSEQLREWLIQQQTEQAADKNREKLEELHYDQSRVDMDNKALQLQGIEMERRRAATVAIKECNQAMIEERRQQERKCYDKEDPLQGQPTATEVKPSLVGVSGLCPSSDRKPPPESLQQITQFRQQQIEERKDIEMERNKEDVEYDRIRLDSARTALLMERQQARLNRQLRRQLDNTNTRLAESQKQRKPYVERGEIDDSFFSKFSGR